MKTEPLKSSKSVLVIVSDGGPDHRVTFGAVKVASLYLFQTLDLDMLNCVRTCPYQSWQNLAEYVMSTLNLALQNVSLARSRTSPELEDFVKNKNTLSDVRDTISKNPNLTAALQDSMAAPPVTVAQRFLAMEVKGIGVKVGNPASTELMSELFSHVSFITLHWKKIHSLVLCYRRTVLQKFFEVHSPSS